MKHEPIQVILLPVTTAIASGVGAEINLPAYFSDAIILLNVTAATGTSPTLNVYIQDVLTPAKAGDLVLGNPTGVKVYDDFGSFTQAVAAGNWVLRCATGGVSIGNVLADGTLAAGTVRAGPVGQMWRVKYTITGTNPSVAFSVVATFLPPT